MNVLIEEGYGLGNATIKVVNTVKGTYMYQDRKLLAYQKTIIF